MFLFAKVTIRQQILLQGQSLLQESYESDLKRFSLLSMEMLRVNSLRHAKLCLLINLTCQYFCQETNQYFYQVYGTISRCMAELVSNVLQQPIEKRKTI